ncbi:hypothetical protein D9M68_382640 [compost metagenome]
MPYFCRLWNSFNANVVFIVQARGFHRSPPVVVPLLRTTFCGERIATIGLRLAGKRLIVEKHFPTCRKSHSHG